jgi:hypothetical protein
MWLLLAMMGGKKISSATMSLIQKSQEETREKWVAFIKFVAKNIITTYRYIKGAPEFVNASTKTTATSLESLADRHDERWKDDILYNFLTNAVDSAVELLLALIKPSTAETFIITSLMDGMSAGPSSRGSLNQARSGEI